MSRKHMGSSIGDFLEEEAAFEEAQSQAVKEVVAWQIAKAMQKKKTSRNRMARLLKTSRTQVNRILDPTIPQFTHFPAVSSSARMYSTIDSLQPSMCVHLP
jgi:antitoxin HicB